MERRDVAKVGAAIGNIVARVRNLYVREPIDGAVETSTGSLRGQDDRAGDTSQEGKAGRVVCRADGVRRRAVRRWGPALSIIQIFSTGAADAVFHAGLREVLGRSENVRAASPMAPPPSRLSRPPTRMRRR